MKTIDLKSGEEETRENPTPKDGEKLGVAMLASMDKELLKYCRKNNDYTLIPGESVKNYNMLLDKALAL